MIDLHGHDEHIRDFFTRLKTHSWFNDVHMLDDNDMTAPSGLYLLY